MTAPAQGAESALALRLELAAQARRRRAATLARYRRR